MTQQDQASRPSTPAAPAGDFLRVRTMVLEMILAGGASSVLALVAWAVMGHTNMPAFSNSYVLRALAVAGITISIVGTAVACYFWVHPRKGHHTRASTFLIKAVVHLAPALLVITAIGVPLAATRLYLDGISVDQVFRTQYLTRMTNHPGWEDMAYMDMPSFYPGLWFFTGGIFAKVTGIAAWAAYQPWALITLSATGAMLVPVWQRITASLPTSSAISLLTVAVTLAVAPEEPYAAIVAMGVAPAMVLGYRAVRGSTLAILGMIVYLGLSANLYTLFTGISALSVVVLALITSWNLRSIRPLLRVTAIGLGSIALALVGWGPYLYALATRPHGPTGKAQHYLPEMGTQIPAPFFESVVLALLSIIAVIWLVTRRRDADAFSLGIGLIVSYAWVILSMLVTVLGTTLLGFRVELPIMLILSTAGALGIAEWLRQDRPQFITVNWGALAAASTKTKAEVAGDDVAAKGGHAADGNTVFVRIMAIVLAFSGIYYATTIPSLNERHIDLAYTDSDGNANRGDRFPADSTAYYTTIDKVLFDKLGTRAGAIILTDEKNFMAYYPYHGYQAITAHYANPLGEFAKRNDEIETWTKITDPAKLTAAMDKAQETHGWQAPDALILRGQLDVEGEIDKSGSLMPKDGSLPTVKGTGDGEFSYMIADDIYPNQPNVRFRTVKFKAKAFAEGWDLNQVGPYVVAIRQR